MIIQTDGRNNLAELVSGGESNNIVAIPIFITYTEPDLVFKEVTVTPGQAGSGSEVTVSWTVANEGNRDTRQSHLNKDGSPRPMGDGQSSWSDSVYLSRDDTIDASDQSFSVSRSGVLQVGESYTQTAQLKIPIDAEGTYYVLIAADGGNGILEFAREFNNFGGTPFTVVLTPPPDLQVSQAIAPDTLQASQRGHVDWTVVNAGTGPTAVSQWLDSIYLSRDTNLDPTTDILIGQKGHSGVLAAGQPYTAGLDFQVPRGISGPYYVIVQTDVNNQVFESTAEHNNIGFDPDPMLITVPPPSDLVIQSITLPASAFAGDPLTVNWTGINLGPNPITGFWSDAVYLSADPTWDVGDKLIGRVEQDRTLTVGGTYTAQLKSTVPGTLPGNYYMIVRSDIFDTIPEGDGEANNQTPSTATLEVKIGTLELGTPAIGTLAAGQQRYYQLVTGPDHTVRLTLDSASLSAANEVYVRLGDVPDQVHYDYEFQTPFSPDQVVTIPTSAEGTYYILVRANYVPGGAASYSLLAEIVPLTLDGITPDEGGDQGYVTTVLTGAGFNAHATVHLVRPGFADVVPESYQVVDGTKIVARFVFEGVPHGLYDVIVTNPDGQQAILPYRYFVTAADAPDVHVGLDGPTAVKAGNTASYTVGLLSQSNVDIPYVMYQYGVS